MTSGRLALVAGALGLVAVACGGGDPMVTPPDANVMVDSAPPDAMEGACFSDLIDLDDPTVGQHTGNQIIYLGTVRSGPGELDPEPGCVTGGTLNEKVHKLTVSTRARVRATTISQNTPNLDSVVYIRTDCTDGSTELACNDNAGALQSFVAANDLAAGTTIFIVVDAATNQPVALPQGYELTVNMDPVVAEGGTCDPTTVNNVCETGTVCSVASGAPVCAPSLGGPTITAANARLRQNGHTIVMPFTASDPDGDILEAWGFFIDGAGNSIDFNGDGVPDEIFFNGLLTTPLPGALSVSTEYRRYGLSPADADRRRTIRLRVIDSSGNSSTPIDVPVIHPDLVGPGDACGPATIECRGELDCTAMTCEIPAATANVCATAEASTAITTAGSYMVNIPVGAPDNLQGSCFWEPGLGEAILKVTIPGPDAVRLTAHTDVAPSPAELDSYLYIRTDCADPTTELGCNDDTPGAGDLRSTVSVPLNPGTYFVVVDGSSEGGGLVGSGMIGVQIDMTTLLAPGAPCTPGLSECAPGHLCGDATGGTTYTCTDADVLYGAECATAPVIVPGTAVTGSVTLSSISLFDATCRFSGPYPEQFNVLTLTGKADVTLSTDGAGTDYDTVIAVIDSCSASANELACNDDIDPGLPNWRSLVTTTLDAGTYYVVVDMSSPSAPDGSGASPDPASYSLLVTTLAVLGSGELCDPAGVMNRCDTGLTCTGTPATCQ